MQDVTAGELQQQLCNVDNLSAPILLLDVRTLVSAQCTVAAIIHAPFKAFCGARGWALTVHRTVHHAQPHPANAMHAGRAQEQRVRQGMPNSMLNVTCVHAPWLRQAGSGSRCRRNSHFADDVVFAAQGVDKDARVIVMDMCVCARGWDAAA